MTDNDGDTVTQSVTIGSDIHFNDDGPKVSSIFASGSVIQDETPGVTGADPVPSNDVSSADLPTGVLAPATITASLMVSPLYLIA